MSIDPRNRDREDPLSIHIVAEPLAASTLVQDYLHGRGAARSFYPGSPFHIQSFRTGLSELNRRFGREQRRSAAAALHPLSEQARQRLDRLVEQGGAVITTGQQAGLLSGPLYTVYKALTVARLAEELESRLGVPVLPVFWTASEDHDWAEVDHAFLSDPSAGVTRLSLPDGPDLPLPMSRHLLGHGVLSVLDEISHLLAGQPHADAVLTWIRGAYQPDRSVAEAFRSLLGTLLAPFHFCITDAADPALKRASAPVLAHALEDAEHLESVLRERGRALESAGYHAQVGTVPGSTLLFWTGPAGRERLDRTAEGFTAGAAGLSFGREELLRTVREAPDSFSPNALLRPVVESAVFPTLAYVGGPGELAYFAQAGVLFPEFGMAPPVAYPRGSALLIEAPMARLLDKLELSVDDLARPRHELVERLARGAVPADLETALERLGRSVSEQFREVIDRAAGVDPTLAAALSRLRNEAMHRVAASDRKVIRHLKREREIGIAQLDRARAQLRPGGAPQDRVLNVLPFIARHGPDLLGRVAAVLEIPLEDVPEAPRLAASAP